MKGSKKVEVDGRALVVPPSSVKIKGRRAPTHISKQLEQLLTVAETAEILRCSEKTVRRRIKDKDLRSIKDGGMVRIDPVDLQDFIRDHRSR